MIYVCSLYSNGISKLDPREQESVLDERVHYTMKRVHKWLLEGKFPYSPILHCHEISREYSLPKEYAFWQAIDRNAIDHCSEVYVLKMKDCYGNWTISTGIQDEITYAESIGKKVTYFDCVDYDLLEKDTLLGDGYDFSEFAHEVRSARRKMDCEVGDVVRELFGVKK